MADLNYSVNLDSSQADSKMRELAKNLASYFAQANKAIKIDADTSQAKAKIDGLAQSAEKAGSSFSKMGGMFSGMLQVFGGNLLTQAFNMLKEGVMSGNKQMETYQTQLETLTGSANMAKETLAKLAKFGAETPFELPELVRAEKVLLGFGFNTEKTMKLAGKNVDEFRAIVGDVAAGTGQRFEDIALYFGKFASGATGEAISRFQELGIVTREQMKEMGITFSKSGELTSPLPKAFEVATKLAEEKFGGGMKKLSGTAEGLMSTLSDNIGAAFRDIGQPIFLAFKEVLSAVADFLSTDLFAGIVSSIKNGFSGAVAVIKSVVGVISELKSVIMIGAALWGVYMIATNAAAIAQWALNAAMTANPVALFAVAIGAGVAALYLLYKNVEPVKNALDLLGAFLKQVGDGILSMLTPVWQALKAIGSILFSVFTVLNAPLVVVYKLFAAIFDRLGDGKADAEGFGNTIKKVMEWLTGAMQTVADVLTSVSNWMADAIGGIIEYLQPVVDFIATVFVGAVKLIGDYFTWVYGIYSAVFGTLINWIVSAVKWFYEIIEASGVFQAIGKAIGDAFNFVWQTVSGIIDLIKGVISSVGDFVNSLTGGTKEVKIEAKIDTDKSLKAIEEKKVKIDATLSLNDAVESLEKAQAQTVELKKKLDEAKASGKPPSDIQAITKELELSEKQTVRLSERIAKDMPSAIKGATTETKVLADGTTELVTKYDINTQAVKDFAKSAKEAYQGDLKKAQEEFNTGIKQQSDEYIKAKEKLASYESKIKAGTATKEELKAYDEAKKKVDELGNKIVENARRGKDAGLETSAAVGTISTAFNKTKEEAEKLLIVQDQQKKKAQETAMSIAEIGAAFDAIKSAEDDALKNDKLALATYKKIELYKKQGKSIEEVRKILLDSVKDDALKQKLEKNLETLYSNDKEAISSLWKQAEQAAKTAQQSADIQAEIDKKLKVKTAEERQKEYNDKAKKSAESALAEKERQSKLAADLIIIEYDKKKRLLEIEKETAIEKAQINYKYSDTKDAKALENEKKTATQKYNDEITKLDREYFSKRIESSKKAAEDEISQRTSIYSAQIDQLSKLLEAGKASEKQISDYRLLLFSKQKLEQDKNLNDLLQKNSDFMRDYNAIIKEGELTLDFDGTNLRLEALRKEYDEKMTMTNEFYKFTKEQNVKANKDLALKIDLEIDTAAERKYLNGIIDLAKREREMAILEAKKTYQLKLQEADGNNELELQAYYEFLDAKAKAESEYQQKTISNNQKIAASFVESMTTIMSAFQFSDSEVTDNSAEINKKYDAERRALEKNLASQEVTVAKFQSSIRALEEKRKEELEKDIVEQKGLWSDFGDSLAQVFRQTYDMIGALHKELIAEQISNSKKLAELNKDLGLQEIASLEQLQARKMELAEQLKAATTDDSKKKIEDQTKQVDTAIQLTEKQANAGMTAMGLVGAQFAAQMGASLASGKITLKSFLKDLIGAVRAAVNAWLAVAFAQELASKSFAGFATFAGISVAVNATLALAQSMVAKYKDGGLAPSGLYSKTLFGNIGKPLMVLAGEAGDEMVMKHSVTARDKAALLEINKRDISLDQFFREKLLPKELAPLDSRLRTIEHHLNRRENYDFSRLEKRMESVEMAIDNSYKRVDVYNHTEIGFDANSYLNAVNSNKQKQVLRG